MKKSTIITIIVVIVIIIGLFIIMKKPATTTVPATDTTAASNSAAPATTTGSNGSAAASSLSSSQANGAVQSIGKSVGGNDISAYHYGSGTKEILFVGGIHGGYEWNTALLAYQMIDYLTKNPSVIPAGVRVTIIPALNPDGLAKVVGTATGSFTAADVSTSQATVVSGRYNGNGVDLNRNFDCDWQTTGVWQNTPVSGGSAAFSEPESAAVKTYIETNAPSAVVVWYSAAGGVYASNCHSGVLPETDAIVKAFAVASGYPANESFDFYATTGDMTNWLAKSGIPAISVLLTDHTSTELSKNIAGVKALLKYYAK